MSQRPDPALTDLQPNLFTIRQQTLRSAMSLLTVLTVLDGQRPLADAEREREVHLSTATILRGIAAELLGLADMQSPTAKEN